MKQRLDLVLVERNLVPTRAKAQALILAGSVFVNGQKRTKAGEQISVAAEIEVRGALPFVGRGGFKLAHALTTFGLDVHGRMAIDVGACTGGFTDVLLQRGARQVFAIDVGYGQLDYRLRTDERVVVLERTNIRQLSALPGDARADCGVVDVSFISLKLVLPAMRQLLQPDAWIVALIKPQFEAGPQDVGRGGVVREPRVHCRVLHEILQFAATDHLPPHGLTISPITGPAGNREFLAWLGGTGPALNIDQAIEDVLAAPLPAEQESADADGA
jgi:23S rRNA (cytidine1920-2'-O)/16S rRNA (cytidine1409-2'-O)-methyltransferase